MWDATRLVSDSWNSSKDSIDCFCCSRSELHEEELGVCHHYPLQIRTAGCSEDVPARPVHCHHFTGLLSSCSVFSWFSLQSWALSCHLSSPWMKLECGPWLEVATLPHRVPAVPHRHCPCEPAGTELCLQPGKWRCQQNEELQFFSPSPVVGLSGNKSVFKTL